MIRLSPKDGEHPLATTKRELHRELSCAYAALAIVSLIAGVIDGVRAPSSALDFGAGLVGVGVFGALGLVHWKWSR
jgi:hypothetical protein